MERQSEIILTGDFNEVIGDDNNKITELIIKSNLIDVHADRHGFEYDFATYKRGKRTN